MIDFITAVLGTAISMAGTVILRPDSTLTEIALVAILYNIVVLRAHFGRTTKPSRPTPKSNTN